MDSLISAVLTALTDAGIPAVKRFPKGTVPRLTGPMAAVSLEKIHAVSGGLCEYLGEEETEDRGLVERYGKRMEATLLIRVYSPDGEAAPAAMDVLLGSIGGITVTEITTQEPEFDPVINGFMTCLRAKLLAYLYAERVSGDETEFLSFRLEGEVK